MVSNNIYDKLNTTSRQLGILIDPDKIADAEELQQKIHFIKQINPSVILVGGSLVRQEQFEETVEQLKTQISIPLVIFPGNNKQITSKADAILLLSLISGRNADLLIGQHVQSAFDLQQSQLEIIPTGYMLIESGTTTSVEYISNTRPIPRNKPEIAQATALAGEQLGLKAFYLEAGSGAELPVPTSLIKAVKTTLTSPLIVGGGITNFLQIEKAWEAGANLVVIGTSFENNPEAFTKNYTDNNT